ncbi:MAG: hypothetical protein ACYCZQ_10845 [Burkholderiales bacterium]
MNNTASFETEIAYRAAQERERLEATVCDQLHRLEALIGMTIVVPEQAQHVDEAERRFVFFPDPVGAAVE